MSWGEAAGGVGGGLSLLGALTKAGGQVSGGQVASTQQLYNSQVADYQAMVAENNATIARETGTRTVEAGEVGATIEGLKTAGLVGRIKANQGANNIDVNTGSAVGVRADAATAGKFSAETVLSNAQLQNWGYRNQAAQFQTQANLDRSGAQFSRNMAPYAVTGGNLAAAGTLLDSASALPWKWLGDQAGGSSDPLATTGDRAAAAAANTFGSVTV